MIPREFTLWWRQASQHQKNREVHNQLMGFRILSVDEMRSYAEEVWQRQRSARQFMLGFRVEYQDGEPVCIQDIPNYTGKVDLAFEILIRFREMVQKYPELWQSFASGLEAYCGDNVQGAGWGACFFLHSDVPDALCFAALYAKCVQKQADSRRTNPVDETDKEWQCQSEVGNGASLNER